MRPEKKERIDMSEFSTFAIDGDGFEEEFGFADFEMKPMATLPSNSSVKKSLSLVDLLPVYPPLAETPACTVHVIERGNGSLSDNGHLKCAIRAIMEQQEALCTRWNPDGSAKGSVNPVYMDKYNSECGIAILAVNKSTQSQIEGFVTAKYIEQADSRMLYIEVACARRGSDCFSTVLQVTEGLCKKAELSTIALRAANPKLVQVWGRHGFVRAVNACNMERSDRMEKGNLHILDTFEKGSRGDEAMEFWMTKCLDKSLYKETRPLVSYGTNKRGRTPTARGYPPSKEVEGKRRLGADRHWYTVRRGKWTKNKK